MSAEPSTEASLTTRARVWFDGLPLWTKSVLVVCISVYVGSLLLGFDSLYMVCFLPEIRVLLIEAYRLLTSAIFHVGLLHVGFNMLAFVPIGRTLETHLGTIMFAEVILLIVVLGEMLYMLLAYTLTLTNIYPRIMAECPIGFSGVVFGLIVIDTRVSGVSQRSILGLFTVPAMYYPWALLVFWQLMIPQISFFGHLCGILIGEMYVRDWLKWMKLSKGAITKIEEFRWFGCCTRLSSFISSEQASAPTSGPLPTHQAQMTSSSGWGIPSGSWLHSLRGGWRPVATAEPSTSTSGFAGTSRTIGGETRVGVPPWAHVEADLAHVQGDVPPQSSTIAEPASSYPVLPVSVPASPAVEEPQPSSSDGDSGGMVFNDAARQQLLEMGFKPHAIQAALRASNGDVERAVEILTGQR